VVALSKLRTTIYGVGHAIRQWIMCNRIKSAIAAILLIAYYFCLPGTLFDDPYATVIESSTGDLIGAKIATDGQWRFPSSDSIPEKFAKCIIAFEDRHFRTHPGFNPVSMFNAMVQNFDAGRVVRGGSTITQQVIRLSRKGRRRSYIEKIIELVQATRLELRSSKDQILALYAAHAPYGGNVVGLEMASWRYFGVKPEQLSWAESATLAVLPNAPALIFPGRNQERLRYKRNKLLKTLLNTRVIDEETYRLSIAEPLPGKPFPLPEVAPHFLQKIAGDQEGRRIRTTLDFSLQQRVNQISAYYYEQYRQNEIHNMAILVVDIHTRNIIAYVGNTPTDADHQKDVDVIFAPRSTGSILKPLLYASMLDDGGILPDMLVPDVPTFISGYRPENYNLTYDGAVPAHRALSRSLNIPSVLMLQDYGVPKFYERLKRFGLHDISKPPGHYGLSLILGGAESNLWDLCRTYAGMAGTLNYFNANDGKYRKNEFVDLNYDSKLRVDFGNVSYNKTILGASPIWFTFDAMERVSRPGDDDAWQFYDSSRRISWKTGTSFGNRDAWAIGTTSDYVVGVWVGNADGEGRAELTGVDSAAPVLFDVFNLLPGSLPFVTPLNDLEETDICISSGFRAASNCPSEKRFIPVKSHASKLCPYHKSIHLDRSEQFRVNSSCAAIDDIVSKSWFILPPVMEWYYKRRHIDYQTLPPWRSDCTATLMPAMDFIYPKNNSKIYLTRDFNSEIQPAIFKVAHSDKAQKLYWYVDKEYKGMTETFHEFAVNVSSGVHLITVVDENGTEIRRNVEIVRD
jgi:penicillin-binding protein 1C